MMPRQPASSVTNDIFAEVATDKISLAEKQLQLHQLRDDYMELLNLIIIFLKGLLGKGVSFRKPDGLHRTRWMARAFFCLKM